jgi:hypothetical protein
LKLGDAVDLVCRTIDFFCVVGLWPTSFSRNELKLSVGGCPVHAIDRVADAQGD